MFRFGFDDTSIGPQSAPNPIQYCPCKRILPSDASMREFLNTRFLKTGEMIVKYLNPQEVLDSCKTGPEGTCLSFAERNHSDLVTGVYEGGLKIWECTYDLLELLQNLNFAGKHVLDLGCGAGMIGIYSALKGAITTFQDYNEEVLKLFTIPNVHLNGIDCDKCNFYSGDWSYFLGFYKLDCGQQFDYIFTSETIYNVEHYNALVDIFKVLLKPSGVIYLAAKSYYFGVGGNLPFFEEKLSQHNLKYIKIWECTEGVKRGILEIKH